MTPIEFFAAQVKRYRTDRGWTQPQLAEHCKKAGLDWDRSIVANVEGKRRSSITVLEVFTLAWVLQVPPALLLFPLATGEPIELVNGMPLQPGLALRWFLGEDDLQANANRDFDREAQTVLVYGELSRVYQAVLDDRINVGAQEAVHGADSKSAVTARERYAGSLASIDRVVRRMEDLGVVPPPLWSKVIEDAARYGKPLPASVLPEPEDDDG